MNAWALRRRIILSCILAAIVAGIALLVYFSLIQKAPSCEDHIKDGAETGIDCSGTCPYLCNATEEEPTVLFTKLLQNGEGRTDVIASVENKNPDAAAKDVPYTLTVYSYDQTVLASATGTLELPPGATVPVFLPGVAVGRAAASTAFLSIASSSVRWYALPKDPRNIPAVSNILFTGSTTTPRITATLSNAGVRAMQNVEVVVIARDASGNALAASRTVLPEIPVGGSATATFTWNAPLSGTPVSIQVLPVIPLP